MPIITIHSYKGGSGKSLIATGLAKYFSEMEKTLLIDGDIYAPSLYHYFQESSKNGDLLEVLDFENKNKKKLHAVISKTEANRLDFVFGPAQDIAQRILYKEWVYFEKAIPAFLGELKSLEKTYKYIIIDSLPARKSLALFYLSVSDHALIVLRPSKYAIEGTFQMISEGKRIDFYNGYTYHTNIKRKDFLVWNQVPNLPKALEEINKHSQIFQDKNIDVLGVNYYNQDLDYYLLQEKQPDLNKIVPYFSHTFDNLTSKLQ